jgi:hypothetical protein
MATVVTMEFANFAPLRDETEVCFKVDGKTVFQQTLPGGSDDDLVDMLADMEEFMTDRLQEMARKGGE